MVLTNWALLAHRPIFKKGKNMSKEQNDAIREMLTWLDQCPMQYSISSIQSGTVHIKVWKDPSPAAASPASEEALNFSFDKEK